MVFGNTGPVGIGTLTMGANTTLLAGTASRTLLNPVVVQGNLTFGGLLATNDVVLNGQVSVTAATTPTITVTSPNVLATLAGGVQMTTGSVGVTKAGPGILILSSSGDNWTGATSWSPAACSN